MKTQPDEEWEVTTNKHYEAPVSCSDSSITLGSLREPLTSFISTIEGQILKMLELLLRSKKSFLAAQLTQLLTVEKMSKGIELFRPHASKNLHSFNSHK